jgi:hypothetical protein
MDANAQKNKIVQWVLSLRDAQMLSLLEDLATPEEELWSKMTPDERASVKRGLDEAEDGNLIPHDEAMKRVRKWR